MDGRVEVELPAAIAAQIEQAMRTSGKPAEQLIVEAVEFWLNNQQRDAAVDEQERLVRELTAEGVFREPTPDDIAGAALWDSLSPEEKAAVRQQLAHLPPGPMISDIVIQGRQ